MDEVLAKPLNPDPPTPPGIPELPDLDVSVDYLQTTAEPMSPDGWDISEPPD